MKAQRSLPALTLLALCVSAAQASTWDASASLGRFDEQVAQGLPREVFPIHATDDAGVAAEAGVAIDAKLEAAVLLPDGSAMETYTGTWNGHPATISRGDGQLFVDIDETDGTVGRFDTAIAGELPAHVHLHDRTPSLSHAEDDDDLVVNEALGGDIVFADGSRGHLYDATWHGSPVVATRSGDHLDITSASPSGVDITGFTAGSDHVEHGSFPAGGGAVSPTLPSATADAAALPASLRRKRRSVDDALSPNRLTFHLMLHDDLGMSSQQLHAGYVAWWLADLQRNIIPGKKVDVLYSQGMPGVTDTRYQYLGSLHDWSDAIENFAEEQHIPRTYKHKFLLVVKGIPEPGRYGRSWQGGSEGIASISGRYPEVAHQLGHLLGARHADAEVRFNRWWCETSMYTPSLLLRSNCYTYSRANMRRIDDYVRTGQGFVERSRWSEDR